MSNRVSRTPANLEIKRLLTILPAKKIAKRCELSK
jgi:hypothetical protein